MNLRTTSHLSCLLNTETAVVSDLWLGPMPHYWWLPLVSLPCGTFFFYKKEMVWCMYLRCKACISTLIAGEIIGCHGFFNDGMAHPKASVECWTRLIKGANLSWMVLIGVITGAGLQLASISLIFLQKELVWCLYLRYKTYIPTLITGEIIGCHGLPKTSLEC